jgi:hypothetical protein
MMSKAAVNTDAGGEHAHTRPRIEWEDEMVSWASTTG